jgi:glycolate oxidase iron-sulfur subunit
MATRLLNRKIKHVKKAAPDIVATGNPGCLLQIQNGLRQEGKEIEVLHPVELLDRAYQAVKKKP